MLVWDGSVSTVCACAKSNRTPSAASLSSAGVRAGPPDPLSASARSVSIVTSNTFWPAIGFRSACPDGRCANQSAAPTRTTAPTANAMRLVARGARTGPGGLGERVPRFRADGIGLRTVSEHCPQPRGERVGLGGWTGAEQAIDRLRGLVGLAARLEGHREARSRAGVLRVVSQLRR